MIFACFERVFQEEERSVRMSPRGKKVEAKRGRGRGGSSSLSRVASESQEREGGTPSKER